MVIRVCSHCGKKLQEGQARLVRFEAPARGCRQIRICSGHSSSCLECTLPPDSIKNISRALFVSIGNFCWQKNFSVVLLRFILCKHSSLFFTVSPRRETEGKKQAKAPFLPSSCLFSRSLANLIPMLLLDGLAFRLP